MTVCDSLCQPQVRWQQHLNFHASFPASFAIELHEEAYWKQLLALFFIFTAAFQAFEVISQLSHTRVKGFSRGAKHRAGNFHRSLRTCVELTRALYRSISANASRGKTTLEPISVSNMTALPNDWRRYYGIKLAELTRKEIPWIREMLREGMVVARHATAAYSEVVVQ